MSSKQPEFKEWNLRATWELDHGKGIARFTIYEITQDGTKERVLQSARFVQGMYFDKDNKLMSPQAVDQLLGLLRLLTNEKGLTERK